MIKEGAKLKMKDKLKEFINRLRNSKEQLYTYSELDTFEYIITPMLQILGWDTTTPDEVEREFNVGKNRVDRALKIKSKVKVLLEGKQVSVNLYGESNQLAEYFGIHSAEHAVLTNGIQWWFYLPLKTGEWDKKRFYVADVLDSEIDGLAGNMITFLSKEAIVDRSALENAEKRYKKERGKREIEAAIPKAWREILEEPNELLIDLIAETTEEICEYKPDRETVASFLANALPQSMVKSKEEKPKGKLITTRQASSVSRQRISLGEKGLISKQLTPTELDPRYYFIAFGNSLKGHETMECIVEVDGEQYTGKIDSHGRLYLHSHSRHKLQEYKQKHASPNQVQLQIIEPLKKYRLL